MVCGENPNPDTHADTYTWRRDGVAAEPETTQTSSASEEWESLPRKAETDEDESTTNPKRTFNPDNREPPDRLGREFSFEVVERENSQTNGSTSDDRKHDHIISTTELNGDNVEQSFLGNAGTHGAGAGSAEESEAATASSGSKSKEAEAQILPRPNATQASMDTGSIPVVAKEEKEKEEKEEKEEEEKEEKEHISNVAGSDSAPEPAPAPAQQLRHTDSRLIDPEVLVHRPITPAIDPQYGDLLPLPPYPTSLTGPGYRYLQDLPSSPLDLDLDLEHLPALPESRPSTPPPATPSSASAPGSGSGSDSRRSSSFKAAVAAMMGTQSLVRNNRQRGHARSRSALDGTTPLNVRVPSQTAVPIQFRLKGKKRSGSVHSFPPASEAWQLPVSRPSSAQGQGHGDAVSGGTVSGGTAASGAVSGGTSPIRSRPRPTSWESSMREMKPLWLVERRSQNAAAGGSAGGGGAAGGGGGSGSVSTPTPVMVDRGSEEEEEVLQPLPPPESFELPEDEYDGLELLPALPGSKAGSKAGSPVVKPQTGERLDMARDMPSGNEEEGLKPVADLALALPGAEPAAEAVEAVEAAERTLNDSAPALAPAPAPGPESIKLPVDEDLDLLPALPESPTTESAVPVSLPAPTPEAVKLPADEDLDLLPALPESPTAESAVAVSLPAVTPHVVEEFPAAEIPKVVEAPKAIEFPAPAKRDVHIPSPETVKLPIDEDLDLLPALPESGPSSPALREPTSPVSVGDEEEEGFATPAEKAITAVVETVKFPEDISLPVDEDLDLLPALPASPTTTESAVPVSLPAVSPEVVAEETEETLKTVDMDAPTTTVAREIMVPDNVKLPVDDGEDLDLLPALPDSPAVETMPSIPVSAPGEEETPKAIETPEPVGNPVTIAPAPETVTLPVDEDLDLFPALPDSLATSPTTETMPHLPFVEKGVTDGTSKVVEHEVPVPENIKLPVDEDLDLLPTLPDSIATSLTTADMPTLLALAPEATETPKPVEVSPEAITLPADEDLDLLPSLPASGNTSPERSSSPHVLDKSTTSPVIVTVPVPEPGAEREAEPETVELPVDEDLDLLPALPESGAASPTKEHASLVTSPAVAPVIAPAVEKDDIDNEAELVSEVSRDLEVSDMPKPETISLPVDEDLDLLPALPESGLASPGEEHASFAILPVATPTILKEILAETEPVLVVDDEVTKETAPKHEPEPEPEPEAIALPVDEDYEDLDLLPALPESGGPASPALVHVSRSASPVASIFGKEQAVPEEVIKKLGGEIIPEPVPENVALPKDQDLDLLPALPESEPASPTRKHVSLATLPVIETVAEPVIEEQPVVEPIVETIDETEVEVAPELLPLPEDQDLDLLPALPESEPASPIKEFSSPVTSPADIPEAVPEDISKAIPEANPELLPLPKDQDLDLLPSLPESGPSSPVSRDFATPVARPNDIPVDEEAKEPSKDSEDALSITIPDPTFVSLPAESDDGLWALPSLPQSRAGPGYASPITTTIPVEEISSPVKAIEETSELSINPETVRLPSDDGLWALPSLPTSREGSGYASPVAAMPTLGVEPPMRDLEEYFPELPLDTLPQLPADEDLDLLPALPESRSESPGTVPPSTPMVEEAVVDPVEKPVESPPAEQNLPEPESVSLPVDEDLDLLPELPESRSSSPGYELPVAVPETEETTEKTVNQPEQLPLPTDEDLDLLPQLPESRSSSPGYNVPVAAPVVEQEEQPTIGNIQVTKDLVQPQDPATTPALSELPSLPVDEDLDLLPELPVSRGVSPDLAVSVPVENQEVPQAEEDTSKQLDLSELPALPVGEDLELLPELLESRDGSPEPEVSLPVNIPQQADLSKLPALPVDEDLDILPALSESRNDSPEPQPVSVPKAISPEVLPLPADADLDLLPELPESRGSTPDQEASLPIVAPGSPIVEEAVKDAIEDPIVAEKDLPQLPALPADEDLDILPALPDSPAVDNFTEDMEETQTTQLLEEVFTQPAWEETQPTQLSDIIEEGLAVPTVQVDEATKDLSSLPALPESRSGTPLSDLPALPESRSSSRSEDVETAPSLEDPSELPPLPESREDSPEPKSPMPVLGTQPATESLAKQIAPSREWNEGETQGTKNMIDKHLNEANVDSAEEPIRTPNEIVVGHVRRDSSDAAHPGDIYEKPSSHTQAKPPMVIGEKDPNEMDYKLAETIYEDMCEDDASTVAASDAPSFLSGANAEQKEQIAKALAGDSEATSSLSPESSFRVLQYLKKRDAAMKQGQTFEEPEEAIPGPSSQYEDEEEQVPLEIEEALEGVEEVRPLLSTSAVYMLLTSSYSRPRKPREYRSCRQRLPSPSLLLLLPRSPTFLKTHLPRKKTSHLTRALPAKSYGLAFQARAPG